MDTSNYPVVSINELREILIDSIHTKRPTLVLSPPGSGKTETAATLARALTYTDPTTGATQPYAFAPLELGLTVPEEIGGVPVRDAQSGQLIRLPLGPIRLAASVPSVLLIDEVTRADASRQGAAMTGVNERRWGDYTLHPGTIVVLAGNEPDSGGVFSILDALLNRCCVVRLRTGRDETRAYLRGGGAPPVEPLAPLDVKLYEAERQRLLTEWADFSEGRPEMIAEEPPRGFAETGALWPSGRAIVHACERIASRVARGGSPTDAVALAQVSGVVGREIGVLWHRINELKDKLPSKAEIEADPAKARTPPDAESAIAALALISVLEPGALWIWLACWSGHEEIKAAAARRSIGKLPPPGNAKALQAFNSLQALIHKAVSNR